MPRTAVCCADIKQIKTGEGWLYLAAVQDLFSRRIVGWAMDRHMRSELVVAALEMAVKARRPAKGTIHHSDHGQPGLNRSSQQLCPKDGTYGTVGREGSPGGRAGAPTVARVRRSDPSREPDSSIRFGVSDPLRALLGQPIRSPSGRRLSLGRPRARSGPQQGSSSRGSSSDGC
ncbi:MAG: transposase [Solirubrobacterales bacterium]